MPRLCLADRLHAYCFVLRVWIRRKIIRLLTMNTVEGLVILLLGIFAALLGAAGKVRYSGRLSISIIVLIVVGLVAVLQNLFR